MAAKLAGLRDHLKLTDVLIPDGQTENGIFNTSRKLNVLFNIRPFFHLNTIHFGLFQIIKKLVSLDFTCTIVLQDLTIYHTKFDNGINTYYDTLKAMDFFHSCLHKHLGTIDNVELLPESLIWKDLSFKDSFFERIIKLSVIAEQVESGCAREGSFFHLDTLNCLAYEGYIKPDFVITGGREVMSVWKEVRKRQNLQGVFGSDYKSPIMLIPPKFLRHTDVAKKMSTAESNDPFVDEFQVTVEVVKAFPKEYKELLLTLHSITENLPEEPLGIIQNFKAIVYK